MHETLTPGKRTEGADEQLAAFVTAIASAREHQRKRFGGKRMTNGTMGIRDIDSLIKLDEEVSSVLTESAKKIDLSPRAFHRVIKLARTIADLDESRHIQAEHILEALQYRPKRLFTSL
jgi:magnesium chelatase family protein